MEFKSVFQTCLDFAKENDGTIATFPEGVNKFIIQSRITRTEILITWRPGFWEAEQIKTATGEKNQTREAISTDEQLCTYLTRFWDPGFCEAEQIKTATGDKNQNRETISTDEQLHTYLTRFWDQIQIEI